MKSSMLYILARLTEVTRPKACSVYLKCTSCVEAQEAAFEEALELLKSFETVDCDRNGPLSIRGSAFFWVER